MKLGSGFKNPNPNFIPLHYQPHSHPRGRCPSFLNFLGPPTCA